jgi:hypothetical protein
MFDLHKIALCDNKNTIWAPNMRLQLFHYITSDNDKSFLAFCHLILILGFLKRLPLPALVKPWNAI